jgi:hypothetical protein
LVSSGTRFRAPLVKATNRPSAEIEGSSLAPPPWPPDEDSLTRVVVPVWSSCTNT